MLVREKYARNLSGCGGLLSGARWHNYPPAIYAAVNSSTAILKKLVDFTTNEIHNNLVTVTLINPDRVATE
ncbi:hypothetical protein A0256_11745 [Mucilaginibacter sp. PAMC 26640]|nr:hypothetical protein A0256_11745 [Mucilaginibacter sp. PAMC 26640]